jgi:hypothetical protein
MSPARASSVSCRDTALGGNPSRVARLKPDHSEI